MRSILVVGHAAIANFEHVRIVPVSRRGPRSQFVLRKTNGGHRVPGVADVARRAPGIATFVRAPLPHLGAAILAEAVQNGAPSFEKRIAHDLVERASPGRCRGCAVYSAV